MIDSQAFMEPANFHITNPYLGRTEWGQKWIAAELVKELAKGPETRNVFLAKHLNVEIGLNYHANRWPGAEFWARGEDASITKEALFARCDVIVVGVDGGGLDDLFGLNLLGRDRDTRDWLSWSHAWCHDGVLQRRKTIASRLQDFERAGELTIVDDELADLSEIVGIIQEVKDAGLLGAVAVDPAGLGEFVEALAQGISVFERMAAQCLSNPCNRTTSTSRSSPIRSIRGSPRCATGSTNGWQWPIRTISDA
jgi:phage terminase large subunit-like protein